MKIKRMFFVAATLLVGSAWAGPVLPDRAAAVASRFWQGLPDAKTDAVLTDRTAEWPFGGIYLFSASTGGFVMVAADDAARPILGYSVTSPLDPARLPVALEEWLSACQEQLDRLSGSGFDVHPEWAGLMDASALKDGTETSVGPLIATHWDQTEPYNEMCPVGTVTGCAATAMAQFMKYWNHPAFGVGQHTYTAGTYGEQSADFAHTLYEWDQMPLAPTELSSVRERDAVSTLMYHCGVALDMAYNTAAAGGSAANGLAGFPGVRSMDNALKDVFRYSPNMQVIARAYGYTNETWRAALVSELDQQRPVLYTGSATQGGHAFICDGYDSRQYMHFNFGWSGEGDGYYPVDSISPGVGGVGGNVTYTFNMNNIALIGAEPDCGLRVSDTLFSYSAEGGEDSLLFSVDPTVDAAWMVTCAEPWLTVSHDTFSNAGWVHLGVDPYDGTSERMATVTFVQGGRSVIVRVIQMNYSVAEMCPLTVVMESTNGMPWQGGARLTLESAGGFVFGTAQLTTAHRDSVSILVAPHDVFSVWHSGGGTDRSINYYVKNQYGEVLVNAPYAYRSGGVHLIPYSCTHVGVSQVEEDLGQIRVVGRRILVEGADGMDIRVCDVVGRSVGTGPLPPGVYFVRIGMLPIRKVVVID